MFETETERIYRYDVLTLKVIYYVPCAEHICILQGCHIILTYAAVLQTLEYTLDWFGHLL